MALLFHGCAPEEIAAEADKVDGDKEDGDENIACEDGPDGILRLGIIQGSFVTALVDDGQPETSNQLTLSPTVVDAPIIHLGKTNVQVVSMVNEDSHALVDSNEVTAEVQPC